MISGWGEQNFTLLMRNSKKGCNRIPFLSKRPVELISNNLEFGGFAVRIQTENDRLTTKAQSRQRVQ
jgi:hypothetical protein